MIRRVRVSRSLSCASDCLAIRPCLGLIPNRSLTCYVTLCGVFLFLTRLYFFVILKFQFLFCVMTSALCPPTRCVTPRRMTNMTLQTIIADGNVAAVRELSTTEILPLVHMYMTAILKEGKNRCEMFRVIHERAQEDPRARGFVSSAVPYVWCRLLDYCLDFDTASVCYALYSDWINDEIDVTEFVYGFMEKYDWAHDEKEWKICRDILDHLIQISTTGESLKEILTSVVQMSLQDFFHYSVKCDQIWNTDGLIIHPDAGRYCQDVATWMVNNGWTPLPEQCEPENHAKFLTTYRSLTCR